MYLFQYEGAITTNSSKSRTTLGVLHITKNSTIAKSTFALLPSSCFAEILNELKVKINRATASWCG